MPGAGKHPNVLVAFHVNWSSVDTAQSVVVESSSESLGNAIPEESITLAVSLLTSGCFFLFFTSSGWFCCLSPLQSAGTCTSNLSSQTTPEGVSGRTLSLEFVSPV